MIATWIVRSSRFSGRVRSSVCICARDSIWNVPIVSAFWISSYTSRSSSGMRERSIVLPCTRATCSTQSSTAESIPSPSRSIFRKPASEHESLSHCTICRPAIAHGCTGTSSISGRVEMTMPPGCCEMWRGRPAISEHSSTNARQRGERELRLGVRQRGELVADARRVPAVGDPREPFEVGVRQPERLADVADRAARAIRRERRDERRVLAAVLLRHAHDQLLADVARESRGRCPAPTTARR